MAGTPPSLHWDRRLGWALAALLLLGTLGPALPKLGHALLGADMVDLHGTAWFYWMVDDAVLHGRSLSHTDRIYFPFGQDLYHNTGINILDALVAIPFRHLLGPVPGNNVFWVGCLVLTFLSARWMCRAVTDDPLAVTVSAAVLTLAPQVLMDLGEGRPTQALLVLPVLFTRALWDTGRKPGWRAPVAAGLLLGLTGYQYWFYGVFAGLGALGHGLVASLHPPAGSGGARAVLLRHTLAAAVALALVSPVALPLVFDAAGGAVTGLIDVSKWSLGYQGTWTLNGNPLSIFSWQPLAGSTGWMMMDGDGGQTFISYVHLVPLAAIPLALWGLARLPDARLRLLGLVVPPALLAIGPTLIVGHLALPNLFAMLMMEGLPFLRRLWWPARGVALVLVPGTLALAFGLAELRRWSNRGARLIAAVLVACTIAQVAFDGLTPVPTWDPTPPSGYRCLAHGPKGAVLELPWGSSQRGLAWQGTHGRPLFGGLAEGNAALVPTQTQTLLREDPLLQRLVFLASNRQAPQSPKALHPRHSQLSGLGITYIVLRRDELTDDPGRDGTIITLLGQPVYRDARTWIFAPWGAPYPCPGVNLPADTKPKPPLVPPRSQRTGTSKWARRLRYPLLAKLPPVPSAARPTR